MIVEIENNIRNTLLTIPEIASYIDAEEIVFNEGVRVYPPAIAIVHNSTSVDKVRRVDDPRFDPGSGPDLLTHDFNLILFYPSTETRQKRGEIETAIYDLPNLLNKKNPKWLSSWDEIQAETYEAEAENPPRKRIYSLMISERR